MSYGKLVQEKLNEKRLEKDAQERKTSFKPNISTMSQRIAAERSKARPSSAYDLLYEDAVRRKEQKKVAQTAEYTFTPSLTTLDPNMFKGVEKPARKQSNP